LAPVSFLNHFTKPKRSIPALGVNPVSYVVIRSVSLVNGDQLGRLARSKAQAGRNFFDEDELAKQPLTASNVT
jgi:hypothetical protein